MGPTLQVNNMNCTATATAMHCGTRPLRRCFDTINALCVIQRAPSRRSPVPEVARNLCAGLDLPLQCGNLKQTGREAKDTPRRTCKTTPRRSVVAAGPRHRPASRRRRSSAGTPACASMRPLQAVELCVVLLQLLPVELHDHIDLLVNVDAAHLASAMRLQVLLHH